MSAPTQARTVEDAVEAEERSAAERPGPRRAHRWLAWAVVVASAVFCAVATVTYQQARSSEALAYGRARDAALADARQGLARLNTVQAATVEGSLQSWLSATTGPLHEQLQRTGGADATTLRQAGASARGTVTEAALTELDTRAGTARLIATVTVELTPKSGAPSTDRKRFEAGLARTPDGWKITSLTAVPVGAS
ncbi:hypothetical protein CFP65_6514 [Kitasatospora sp. MMS16-BH015]|uniref:hypothetical protein n=1 Tax=Kitasatospora sp. MMS16-BH015 TaxID=2018025 RepID=UPI000CA1546D|nr:hypothetical protein [Kitasatospora sp. MMS16-BH015]AUG81167.1 hypothetical protein CFP65_6514 [Kitasatospora sp. MMS16-BH015]